MSKKATTKHALATVITHPEKVLFPAEKGHAAITKGDLAAYYEAIAPMHGAAHPRAADHDGAVSGRHRQEGLHPEGRLEGFSGMARARRGAEEGRDRAPSHRHRHAVAPLDRQPEHHHAACVVVARAGPLSPRHLRLRPRPFRGGCRRLARRRARASRPPEEAGPAQLGEDLRVEGLPHRRAARRQGRHGRGVGVRAPRWCECW